MAKSYICRYKYLCIHRYKYLWIHIIYTYIILQPAEGCNWLAARWCCWKPASCGCYYWCRAGASGSEPGLSASGVLSPSWGGCYNCAPCGIRFVGRKWRSNFARHTNMFITGNGPSTSPHRRQARHLANSSPALFSLCASGDHLLSPTQARPLTAACLQNVAAPVSPMSSHDYVDCFPPPLIGPCPLRIAVTPPLLAWSGFPMHAYTTIYYHILPACIYYLQPCPTHLSHITSQRNVF
jgi:hypothetical protein